MSEGTHEALSLSERKTMNHSIINEQTNEYRSKQKIAKSLKSCLGDCCLPTTAAPIQQDCQTLEEFLLQINQRV